MPTCRGNRPQGHWSPNSFIRLSGFHSDRSTYYWPCTPLPAIASNSIASLIFSSHLGVRAHFGASASEGC
jgi:hypothetical protein